MNVVQVEPDINDLPRFDSSDNPTHCCPRFDPAGWDGRHLRFRDKLFVRAQTKSLLHIPVNMGRVFSKTFDAIEKAGAQDMSQFIVLSRELSPWSAEHLFSVTHKVPGQQTVQVSGDFDTQVFEGPYKNVGKWRKALLTSFAADDSGGAQVAETFFFYTTCPKCAKFYGKNYVVGVVGTNLDAPIISV